MNHAHLQRSSDGLIRGVALAIVPSLIAWSAIFMLVSRIG